MFENNCGMEYFNYMHLQRNVRKEFLSAKIMRADFDEDESNVYFYLYSNTQKSG